MHAKIDNISRGSFLVWGGGGDGWQETQMYQRNLILRLVMRGIVFHHNFAYRNNHTVEPRYNEVLGTMKITLLYQVSHYIRVKTKKYKELGPAKLPCYKRVLLYPTSL